MKIGCRTQDCFNEADLFFLMIIDDDVFCYCHQCYKNEIYESVKFYIHYNEMKEISYNECVKKIKARILK